MSALLLARGFVAKSGRIGMIETESGRGEAYADPREYPELAGNGKTNYDVLPLRDDFSPRAYGAAIKQAEAAKFDALIIDSSSHEWEGPGGVLAMAAANAEKLKGVLVWQRPKIEHKREFMLRLMQTPVPLVVVCMRAKYPMEQTINHKGEKEWTRSTKLEPIQSDDILFEMFVHGWIDQAHKFHLTKTTSRTLASVFENEKPITLDTGAKLARWAEGADLGLSNAPPTHPVGEGIGATQMKLIELEGREAAEGPESAVDAWAQKVRREHWAAMSDAERKQLSALKTELLAITRKVA